MNKTPISHILIATDFSECADQAVAYAGLLAAASPAPLDILHVVDVTPDMHPDDVVADRSFEQRFCFRWANTGAKDDEIMDYH